jgi:TetR/AcrR family fatty acid metabolism transcriptional regulator
MIDLKRDARKQLKRRAIVDAAISTFATRGFHKSRVSDIASRAGVADGTIYLYFKSKDDLLITIFEENMARLIDRLRTAIEDVGRWDDKLRTFASEHMLQVETNPELASVLQVELRLSSKFMKEYVPRRLQDYLDIVGDVIREGQESGRIRPDVNPKIIRRAFFGALDEIAMQWVLSDRRHTLAEVAREVAEVFIDGMRARASIQESQQAQQGERL